MIRRVKPYFKGGLRFGTKRVARDTAVRDDRSGKILEGGLEFVFNHPVLRALSSIDVSVNHRLAIENHLDQRTLQVTSMVFHSPPVCPLDRRFRGVIQGPNDMFPTVNTGRCDLDFEPALHRIFRIAPEEQSTVRLGRGLVLQSDLKIPEFFLGPDDSTRCFRRVKNTFLKNPMLVQVHRLGRQ